MKWHLIFINGRKFNINSVNENAIGGVESSACYLMRYLKNLQQDVNFWSEHCDDKTIENVRHYKLSDFQQLAAHKANEGQEGVIIYNGLLKYLENLRRNVDKKIPIFFWTQHSYDQPSIAELKNKNVIKNLDGIVFVSEWQRISCTNFFNIDTIPTYCIGNGITPEFTNAFSSLEEFKKNKINNLGIYSSAPYRGLDSLYRLSKNINEEIVIDIYSSMKVYDQTENQKLIDLYKKISERKVFKYCGSVTKKELAKAFINKSFLTYPCTFAETFCITLLDSLAMGLKPITTNLGALNETSMGFSKILNINNNFLEEYAKVLDLSIREKKLDFNKWCEKQYDQYLFVNKNYTWLNKAQQWLDLAKMTNLRKIF
jgi:hypothetical protein